MKGFTNIGSWEVKRKKFTVNILQIIKSNASNVDIFIIDLSILRNIDITKKQVTTKAIPLLIIAPKTPNFGIRITPHNAVTTAIVMGKIKLFFALSKATLISNINNMRLEGMYVQIK